MMLVGVSWRWEDEERTEFREVTGAFSGGVTRAVRLAFERRRTVLRRFTATKSRELSGNGPQSSECGPPWRGPEQPGLLSKSEGRFEGYSGQRPLERCARNAEASSCFSNRQAPDGV
jgi:hypothetical protein